MNKEEIYKILENNLDIISCREVIGYIEKLQEENKKLKDKVLELSNHITLYSSEETLLNRIDKAIEYIEENEFYLDYKTGACIKGVIPLLKILRGEE